MVQALAANRTDESFDIRVLPRRAGCAQDLFNVQCLGGLVKLSFVACVTITQQKSWCRVPRKGMSELLGCPFRSGMWSDAEMQYTATIMRQHQEHKEQTESCRGDNEEVNGNQFVYVIGEEGLPGL